jgi:alpha-glucosidase
MWKVTSPKGTLSVAVKHGTAGDLSYTVEKHGRPVTVDCNLGLMTGLCDFTQGLQFSHQQTNEIRETYSIPVGKKAVYTNNANEIALHFMRDGLPFVLRVRAYDEGMAFRYEIPVEGEALSVLYETTDFRFPESFDKLWLQDWVASYEAPYNKTAWGIHNKDRHFGMPSLLYSQQNECWVMINEANVLNTNGSYCISHLKGTEERRLVLDFAPEEHGQPIPSFMPFTSPWRLMVVEDSLDGIVNATLNYNLNPPSVIEDTSWIRPVRALWAWWSSDMGAQLYTEAKQYVDFAAAMGFEAVVLDALWDESWIKEFCDFAHKRNISPWLWTAMQSIDTYEKASHFLPLWKSWGIDGVKIDFFENDSHHTAWQYNMMADIMKEQKLMINFHGSTKPMGEGRTWPHFMTAEGIMGLEHYKWSDMPDAGHNCTVPFIRNAAGPMDYTPVGFSNKNRNTSLAHQMALAAVFNSGCQHYSASIFHLEPWEGTNFLRRLKPKYDGVKVLSGFPGDHVTMLRWVNKTEEYIIGCITNANRTLRLAFDFLPPGEFEAEIYGDNRFGNAITYEKIKVTRDTVRDIVMPEHGGTGIYIAREVKPLAMGFSGGYMSDRLARYPAEGARVMHGSEMVNLSREQKAVMLSGSVEFMINDLPAFKRYTLRFYYMAESPWKVEITDGKAKVKADMMQSGAPGIMVAGQLTMLLGEGSARLIIRRLSGAVPIITELRVIDNDPPETIAINAGAGIVSGGAELMDAGDGEYKAVGLGHGGEIVFDNVMLPKDGAYILRINYNAGVGGAAGVYVNGGEPVRAYLAGVGLWGATRRGDILGREVLVLLSRGKNIIRIASIESTLPYIREITITPNV